MFQLLFRYPPAAYARGHLVFLAAWPVWVLGACIVAAAGGLYWLLRARWSFRTAAVWGLEAFVLALILALLWEPALSLTELKPQQNIVAVLLDDSASMALTDGGGATREARALAALHAGLLRSLGERFQVRLYTFDAGLHRLPDAAALASVEPIAPATRIGASLDQLLEQTSDLPLGGIVLLTDGADNPGGIDRATLDRLQARQIPIQTVGLGTTAAARDVELDEVELQPRALAKSRVEAVVHFHQTGFAGQRTTLSVRAGGQVLASQPVTLGPDGDTQTATVMFNAGPAGLKTLAFGLAPLGGEASSANNAATRLLNVVTAPHRVLYIEGEPRWEYKFIRRAEAGDPQVQLVSMLRATENKIYRQGIADPGELAQGFPSRPEDLFRYAALIIGSVQAGYFTPVQQDLIRAFADRRGGGILFMGGQYALADGGWGDSPLAALLPTVLPQRRGTFVRADLSSNNGDPAAAQAYAQLAPAGADSIITRLVDDPAANAAKWQKLPWLMDYQDAGTPKPGASVLANVLTPDHRVLPLLVTENYGRGRTALLATSGTWRWQMMLPLGDPTYSLFWQQLIRWLAAASPGPVAASVPATMLYDNGAVHLTAEVRDPAYNPAPTANVTASILGPDGLSTTVPLHPSPDSPGVYEGDFNAARAGSYLAQVTAPGFGTDTVGFERLDGTREAFHTAQNRDLLEQLATATGGQYWQPGQVGGLAAAVPYSSAGLTARDNLPLWNLPILFLLLLAAPLGEWFLRRKWGVV